MSARQQRNVQYLALGNSAAALSASTDIDGLNAGEVAVFTPEGVRLSDALGLPANVERFIVVTDRGSEPNLVSDVIEVSKIKNVSSAAADGATEQRDVIGYNGTSGAIEEINDNLYMVDLYIQEYLTSNTDGRYIKHFQYKSDLNTTQDEVAIGLVGSAVHNFSREAEDYMDFKALCSDAGAASTVAFDARKGSKAIVYAAAPTVAIGDFVRFGTATTDNVYRVEKVVGNTVTLDRCVTDATGNFAIGASEEITAAAGAAADWGIVMEGKPLSFRIGKEFYKKVRWEYSLNNFGSTNSQREAIAYEGVGTYEQIAELEWFVQGHEGEFFRMGEPGIYDARKDVEAGETYNQADVTFTEESVVGFQANVSPKQLSIAVPAGAGYAADLAATLTGITGVTVTL
jgi:uncharacterized protein YkvS